MKIQLAMLKCSHSPVVNELIDTFKIDTTADLKRMSKGMKKKVALVCAFMTQPPVLLLDEPTTGLDPVMRDAFIDLVKRVKEGGTTIIMSSHMFNELEPTCDRIGFLHQGKLIDVLDQARIHQIHQTKRVTMVFRHMKDFQRARQAPTSVGTVKDGALTVRQTLTPNQLPQWLGQVKNYDLLDLQIEPLSLDYYFSQKIN